MSKLTILAIEDTIQLQSRMALGRDYLINR